MTAELNEKTQEAIVGVIPMKRMGESKDIATISAFLASEDAAILLVKFLQLTVVWSCDAKCIQFNQTQE